MRVTRWGAIAISLLAVLTGVGVSGSSATPVGGQATANGIDSLRTCLATNGRLDAVLIVDETISLQRTDPKDERVGALQAVIDSVALAAGSRGERAEPIAVSLLIAGFARNFSPAEQGWIDVNPSSIPELRGIAEGFRSRDSVVGTDYLMALQGAQDALDQRAVESSAETPACRLVVLFSDGEYELGDQPSGARVDYAPEFDLGDRSQRVQAVAAGFGRLCDQGGLLDRMRSTRPATILIGLGLQLGSRLPEQLELPIPSDALFEALATGTGPGGVECGNPNSAAFGAVTTADQLRDLGVGIFCSLNGCPPTPAGNVGEPVTVAVDAGVTALVVQAAGNPGFDFTVTDPSGETISVASGIADVATGLVADVVVEPQSGLFSVARVTMPPEGSNAIGDWTFGATIDGQPAGGAVTLGVSRQSGLSLESDDQFRLTVGEATTFSAQLRSPGGDAIGTNELDGDYEVRAELLEPGTLQPIGQVDAAIDPRSGEVLLDVTDPPTTDLTNLFLEARLAGRYSDGQQRQPVIFTRSVPVLRGGLPLLAAPGAGVRLSGVRGGTDDPTARGTVPVSADGDVVGRACVVGYEQLGPVEAPSAVLAGGSGTCVDLDPGETRDLELALALSEVQSGEYSGNVLVELTAPADPRIDSATVRVPVGFAGYAPLCTGVLLTTIIGTLALAAGVVGALLLVLAHLAARFPREGNRSKFARIAVAVVGDSVERDGTAFFLDRDDFDGLVAATDSGGQTLALGDTGANITPKARMFGMPQAVIDAGTGAVIGCEDGVLQRRRGGRSGRIRHEITGSWAFELSTARLVSGEASASSDSSVAFEGTLWVFRDDWAGGDSLFDLAERVRRGLTGARVQDAARRLAEELAQDDGPGLVAGLRDRFGGRTEPPVTVEDYSPPKPRRL